MKPFERIWSALSIACAFLGFVNGLIGDDARMVFGFIVAVGFAVAADSVAEQA